jgi:hypothetical protein
MMIRHGMPFALIWTALILTSSACAPTEQSSQHLAFLAAQNSQPEDQYLAISKKVLPSLIAQGFKLNHDHRNHPDYTFGYSTKNALASLKKSHPAAIKTYSHIESLGAIDPVTLKSSFEGIDDLNLIKEGYHDYQALTAALKSVEQSHPNLATIESIGESVAGRQLWMAKMTDKSISTPKIKLLYIGNMHGDEAVGREMLIRLIEDFATNFDRDAQITRLLTHAEIFIVPSMNPDGFESARRHNANYRDLNRNFPDFTSDPSDTENGREPETIAIMRLHQQHHFVLAMNFHGGTVCMNLPWDTQPNHPAQERFGDVELLQELSETYASTNDQMYRNHGGSFEHGVTYGYEWYEVDGGLQDWANHYRRSIHATAELSHSKFPSASSLDGFWQANRAGMLDYLAGGLFGYFFQVLDHQGRALDYVDVKIEGSSRWVRYQGGLVMKPAPQGTNGIWLRSDGIAAMQTNLVAQPYLGDMEQIEVGTDL